MSPKMTDVEIVEHTIAQLNDKCDLLLRAPARNSTVQRAGPSSCSLPRQVGECRGHETTPTACGRNRKPMQAAAQFRR